MTKLSVTMFPAKNGDCFLITIGEVNRKHFLIDCGYSETYSHYLREELHSIAKKKENISLMVITHVDQDHILGAIAFLNDNNNKPFISISEIWHNSYRHLQFSKIMNDQIGEFEKKALEEEIALGNSFIAGLDKGLVKESDISLEQGSSLASLIYQGHYRWNASYGEKAVCRQNNKFVEIEGIKIWIVSPDEEKLGHLSNSWLEHLQNHKFNFKLTDDIIFDDAFEFYLLRKLDGTPVEENISTNRIIDLDIEKVINNCTNIVDTSTINGSSIAILIEYAGKKLLFLGDAHPNIICSNLKIIEEQGINIDNFDLVKLPHHGSIKNMTPELATLLKSDKYLISTNGYIHNHPDLEAIARIIRAQQNRQKEFIFNYPLEIAQLLLNKDWMFKYNYTVNIGDGTKPLVINL